MSPENRAVFIASNHRSWVSNDPYSSGDITLEVPKQIHTNQMLRMCLYFQLHRADFACQVPKIAPTELVETECSSSANLPSPKACPILQHPKRNQTKLPSNHKRDQLLEPAICIFQPRELRLKNQSAEPTNNTAKAMKAANAAGTCQ